MSVLAQLRDLLGSPLFRRFFAIRLLCQSGDGMFQAALATLFFFSPERQSTPQGIALAVIVMLAPFTIAGPLVGGFADRWRRRNIIVVTDSLRCALSAVIVAVLLTVGFTFWVYVLALVALSLNRFLLAALGASLPRVVTSDELIVANSVLPTVGALATGVGALSGFALGLILPDGVMRDAATLSVAILAFAASVAVAWGFAPDQLGPTVDERWEALRSSGWSIASDVLRAATVLFRRAEPAGAALVLMTSMRFFYGVYFIAAILLTRNVFAHDGTGLGSFAVVVALTAVGFGVAVAVTPFAVSRFAMSGWVGACLLIMALSFALISVVTRPWSVSVAALLLGLSTQGAKIVFDTVVQTRSPDALRGRAFVIYDFLYNCAFIGASLFCVAWLPHTGQATWLFVLCAGLFVVSGILQIKRGRVALSHQKSGNPVLPTSRG